MERNNIHLSIQVGGTGNGFTLPVQILRKEPRKEQLIGREALMLAHRKARGVGDAELDRKSVYRRNLENRIFEIHQRKRFTDTEQGSYSTMEFYIIEAKNNSTRKSILKSIGGNIVAPNALRAAEWISSIQ